MNNILRIAIIICTSYISIPSYAMVKHKPSSNMPYDAVAGGALKIIRDIDEGIAAGKLANEDAIRQSLEEQFRTCSKNEELLKRIPGLCVARYCDRVNEMPLALVMNGNRRFYVDWKGDKPQSAYMVTEDDPKKILIWQHGDNGWRQGDMHTLDEREKSTGINFVQPLGERLALGVYKNNNRENAVLRIYEKLNRAKSSTWKKWDKIRIFGGDVMSCAVSNDLKYCAILINTFFSGNQLRLKLFKQAGSGPYEFLWAKGIDDAREIISLTPPTLTVRGDRKLIEVNINDERFSSKLTPHLYENPRSVTRLIAHTLYQNHLAKQKASAVTPVPAVIATSLQASDDDDYYDQRNSPSPAQASPPVLMPFVQIPVAISSRPGSDYGDDQHSPITQENTGQKVSPVLKFEECDEDDDDAVARGCVGSLLDDDDAK